MRIVLTGGTGYIGSALLTRLVADGHTVTALVRSEDAAAKIVGRGAEPVVGDLFDLGWVAEQFAAGDAVAHTASPGDASSEKLDRAVATAAVQALGGTGKQYVHTSGIWIYGDNDAITEESPLQPPALTAWRSAVEAIALDDSLVTTIVTPGIVYGYGTGIPTVLTQRDDNGKVRLVGDGSAHWTTVHVDDVAALFALAVTRGERLGHLLAISGDNPTVREIAEAGAGAAGVTPESDDETRARIGALFADALLLDQQATGERARSLGWKPSATSLVEEFRNGSYAL
jgi:nucleoside-diphosphate-sugar epimerase